MVVHWRETIVDPFVKTASVSELNTAGRAGIDGALAEVLSSSTDGMRERARDQDLSSRCHEESDRTRPGGLKEGSPFRVCLRDLLSASSERGEDEGVEHGLLPLDAQHGCSADSLSGS